MIHTDNPDLATVYRKLLENPLDRNVRLVYADMLTDTGNYIYEALAEHIRIEVRYAEMVREDNESIDKFISRRASLAKLAIRLRNDFESDWRDGNQCGNCFGKGAVTYGMEETVATCTVCKGRGFMGVLSGRIEDTWIPEMDKNYNDHVWDCLWNRGLWNRGLVNTITIPMQDYLDNAVDLFSQWPILGVDISDKEPQEYIGHGIGSLTAGEPRYSWINGLFGNSSQYIPTFLFKLIKDYALMGKGHSGAMEGLSKACVLYGRDVAGLPFIHPDTLWPCLTPERK